MSDQDLLGFSTWWWTHVIKNFGDCYYLLVISLIVGQASSVGFVGL